MKLTRQRMEWWEQKGEGGKGMKWQRKEEENKEVIKFDFFCIHCQLVALRGNESRVHFLVTVVREISRDSACFYLRNNEEAYSTPAAGTLLNPPSLCLNKKKRCDGLSCFKIRQHRGLVCRKKVTWDSELQVRRALAGWGFLRWSSAAEEHINVATMSS